MVFIQGTRFTRGGGTNRKGAAGSKPRPLYKYHVFSSLTVLHTSYPAYEDGTDSVPKRRHTIIRRRGNNQKNTYKNVVVLGPSQFAACLVSGITDKFRVDVL